VEKELVEIDLLTSVKVAFYRALQSKKIKKVAQETYTGLFSHEQDTSHFYENSVVPKNDLLKSQVATANAKQRNVRADADEKNSLFYLSKLLSLDKRTSFDVMEEETEEIHPSLSLDALIQEAQKSRPEVRALHLAIKNLDHSITLAQSPYYPQVYLTGRYEERGKNFLDREFIYTERFNTIVNLELRWEFFHFGKTRAESMKKVHEKKAIENELQSVIDDVEFQVKNAFLNLDVAQKNIETAKTALSQAEEHWRITNLQFQERLTTNTEVLDAQAFLTEAKANYYVAYYGYKISLAQLERAVGKKLGRL
jgi:outer membrane protein